MSSITEILTERQKRALENDEGLLSKHGPHLRQWPEDVVRRELSLKLGFPWIEAAPSMVDIGLFASNIPACRELGFLPTFGGDISLHVLMSEPFHSPAIRSLRNLFHREIHPLGTSRRALERTLSWLESSITPTSTGVLPRKDEPELTSWRYSPEEGVKFIERVISEAYRRKASDVFLESYPDRMDIRFRGSDGCVVMPPISQKHAGRVLQDAKAFSGLSTRESRGYRGGSAEMTMPDGNVINLRVEAQRAFSGEAITLRLLDKRVVTSLSRTLPFPPAYAGVMRDILNQKSGIVIVCGPTGSGKTTTLWRCLLSLDSSEMRIMTIEDPVEYRFDRVVQLPVRGKEESDIQESEHPETFISALRSCLRANPDVVLVGEMRDSETAATAVQASLTGHLILSTLHTPDSTGAIPRLMNMGVDALNIRQTLSAVVYQRLAPRLCPKCRIAEKPTPEQLAHYEFYGLPAPDFLFRRCGCPDCRNLGFDGKEAVFEILIITPELRRHIKADFDDGAFRALWIDQGGRTLAATALELAAKGILSYKLVKELDGAWIIHSGAKEIGSLRQKG